QRHVAGEIFPQRHVAGENPEMSLGKTPIVVVSDHWRKAHRAIVRESANPQRSLSKTEPRASEEPKLLISGTRLRAKRQIRIFSGPHMDKWLSFIPARA
ncbi:hypothetical protein Tco_0135720, partial [Tanacetum coccineum]